MHKYWFPFDYYIFDRLQMGFKHRQEEDGYSLIKGKYTIKVYPDGIKIHSWK